MFIGCYKLIKLTPFYFFQLYVKETRKKVKYAPTNFNPPNGIMGLPSDKLNLCWTLD